MTHVYDRAQTFKYFSDFAHLYDSYTDETRPHPRDRILLERILPALPDRAMAMIDYGCGAGHLLAKLAGRGHIVTGIEPNEKLAALAEQKLKAHARGGSRVRLGGLATLSEVPAGSIDVFVSMGVFQYLSDEEYATTLREVRRVLHPEGYLICTYQNALFDLITFNKYTVDFFAHQLFPPLEPYGLDRSAAVESLKRLMPSCDLPRASESRARDSIFVRLSNPLTIGDELRGSGFQLADLYFYEFQPVPPLIAPDLGDSAKKVAAALEVDKAKEWYGYFLGSAFLAMCRPATD